MDDDDDGPTADLLNYAFDLDGARLEREAERRLARTLSGNAEPATCDPQSSSAREPATEIQTNVLISKEPVMTDGTTTTNKRSKRKKGHGGWARVTRKKREADSATAAPDDLPDADDVDVVELPGEMPGSVSSAAFDDLKVTLEGVRAIDPRHVSKVGASLVEAGRMFVPLVIDMNGEVVDGRHRFTFLGEKRSDLVFNLCCPGGKVPVVRLDYSAAAEPERAVLDALRIAHVSRRLKGEDLSHAIARLVTIYGEPRRGRPANNAQGVYDIIANALDISTKTVARHHRRATSDRTEVDINDELAERKRLLTRARSALAKALTALAPEQQAAAEPVLRLLDDQLGAEAVSATT